MIWGFFEEVVLEGDPELLVDEGVSEVESEFEGHESEFEEFVVGLSDCSEVVVKTTELGSVENTVIVGISEPELELTETIVGFPPEEVVV